MKKKILAVFMCVVLTGCGNTVQETNVTESTEVKESIVETKEETKVESVVETKETEDIAQEQFNDIGNIEVEVELFDVEITIPKSFIGDGATQESLNAVAEKNENINEIKLNDDGSAVYIMSKRQHENLMKEYADQIMESINAYPNSTDYPNVTAIEVNDDFTEFDIYTKSSEPDFMEKILVTQMQMNGGMYGIFNGTSDKEIIVRFRNSDSKEVIFEKSNKE